MGTGLTDELRILVNPVILGAGNAVFAGAVDRFAPTLMQSRTFPSGNVLLRYHPATR